MKKRIGSFLFFALGGAFVFAQEAPASGPTAWQFNAHANFYFIPDDFFILPVFQADKNKLHLEARYNYEDRETFSAWIGYNFQGGNKLEYTITPMLGGVVGRSDGMAPGLEVTLNFKGFELYSEGEVYLDFQTEENHYLYNWSDLTYSPKDWLWFGISAQRTRVYQTALDIQRGVLIGAGLKNWELTTYVYNLGFEDPFVLVSISKQF
ncbi:hypothetical protein [Chryseolinea soli]|uniref:Uncharacterized protein n=1 Tax=Chryseolinea soli TaxID=2321403 RepID=A0A385SYT5_9BACT|nr:hypothetical protein [Chryseolinea soli]AYB35277.1 hypothetical protein D4L85_33915 [Chryseolinea soli]